MKKKSTLILFAVVLISLIYLTFRFAQISHAWYLEINRFYQKKNSIEMKQLENRTNINIPNYQVKFEIKDNCKLDVEVLNSLYNPRIWSAFIRCESDNNPLEINLISNPQDTDESVRFEQDNKIWHFDISRMHTKTNTKLLIHGGSYDDKIWTDIKESLVIGE